MATLYTQQDSNVRKTWLLMTLIFIILIYYLLPVRIYYRDCGGLRYGPCNTYYFISTEKIKEIKQSYWVE